MSTQFRTLLAVVWLGGLAVAAILLSALSEHRKALDAEAAAETLVSARLIAAHADHILGKALADVAHLSAEFPLPEREGREGREVLESRDAALIAHARQELQEGFRQFRVIDADGRYRDGTTLASVATAPWFRALRDGGQPWVVATLPATPAAAGGQTGPDTGGLLLAVGRYRGGRFAGAISATLDPDIALGNFVRSVTRQAGELAELRSRQGGLLLRLFGPGTAVPAGDTDVLAAAGADLVGSAGEGADRRVVAQRGMETGDLVVLYSRSERQYLATWNERRNTTAFAILALFAGNLLITWLLLRAGRQDRRMHAILDRAGEALYRFSSRDGGLDYRGGVEHLLGLTRAQLLADPQRWAKSIHPDDVPVVAEAMARLAPGELFSVEYRLRHADGRWLWVLDRAVRIQQRGDELIIDGVATDITAERRLREHVERERGTLRQVLDSIPDIVFLKSAEGSYREVNRAFLDFTGRPREEIIGRTDADLFPADFAVSIAEDDERVRLRGRSRRRENWLSRDGQHVGFETEKQAIRDADGGYAGLVGVAHDLTAADTAERDRQRLLEELTGLRIASARAEVASERNRAEQLLRAVGDAVLGVDAEGRIVFLNPAAERLFGYAAEQANGKSLHALVHHTRADGSACPAADCPISQAMHHPAGRVAGVDTFWRRDGSSFAGDYAFMPMTISGKLSGGVLSLRDVTEREQMAQRLRMLSRAVEDSPASVALTDRRGVIQYVNRRFTEITGYGEDEAIGATHRLVSSGQTSAERYADLWSRLEAGEDWQGDFLNRRRDGSLYWARNRISPLRDAEGRITHYMAISEDVTPTRALEIAEREARATAESALHEIAEQGRRLRQMTDNVPAMINYVAPDLTEIYCNEPFARFFGFEREAMVGRPLREVIGDAVFNEIEGYFLAALAGREVHYEASRQGRTLAVSMTASRDAAGVVTGVHVLAIDVTEERAAAETLRRAMQEAESANVAKSQFLANISHEIRTPMNAILGLSELLLRTKLSDQQRSYLEKSHRSARLLLGLLDDVLDLSKIEAGRLALDPQPFELDEIVEKIADLYGDAAAEKGIEFVIDLAPAVPRVLVGDALRLTQVISNLCSNAVKFTGQGHVILHIDAAPAEAGRIALKVGVRDTGIGMDAAQMARVFDPFVQADGSTTRRYGGSGLGLAICRNLVEHLGGHITIESTPGQGSCFRFDALLALPEPAAADAGSDAAPLVARAALCLGDAAQREAVRHVLQSLGAEVQDCADAEAAVQSITAAGEGFVLLVADDGPDAMDVASRLAGRFAHRRGGLLLVGRHTAGGTPPGEGVARIARPVIRRAVVGALLRLRGEATPADDDRRIDLAGMHVLVVDDYSLNVEIVSTILHEAHCRVTVATHGREALERLDAVPGIDVVLMDCQMPVMDGYEATRALRADARWSSLPVIAMTANVLQGDREKCFAAGMNDFLAKPVEVARLLALLSRFATPEMRNRGLPGGELAVTSIPVDPGASGLRLDRLTHLDLDAALQATMGKIEFLERILRIFQTTQTDFAQRFQAARADSTDPEAASRTAHTLKGAAASIGAGPLREAALALEQAVKQGSPAAEVDALLATVLAELGPVLAGIHAALPGAAAPSKVDAGGTAA